MVEGEAGYSCANHCEASLQVLAAITGWAARLPGVAVLPVKGTRCSDSTPWVAQRALPSSRTSTPPNLPLPSSRRHPKVAVGGSRCAASSAGWAPPVPAREADCCAGSATGRTSKAVAMEPVAEGRPGSLSGPDDPPAKACSGDRLVSVPPSSLQWRPTGECLTEWLAVGRPPPSLI